MSDFEGLTLGPGVPTLPAAPGKPVAPYNEEHIFVLKNQRSVNFQKN